MSDLERGKPYEWIVIDVTDHQQKTGVVRSIQSKNMSVRFTMKEHFWLDDKNRSYRFHLYRFPVRIGCSAGAAGDLDPPGQAHPGDSLGISTRRTTPVRSQNPALAGLALDPGAGLVMHNYRAISMATGADHISLPPWYRSRVLGAFSFVKMALWFFIPTPSLPFA